MLTSLLSIPVSAEAWHIIVSLSFTSFKYISSDCCLTMCLFGFSIYDCMLFMVCNFEIVSPLPFGDRPGTHFLHFLPWGVLT